MTYTIKKLAELSKVSTRTLRWYDEIGLLKPAYYASNGYRYYEEKELLQLQQILFFRELGIKLEDIKRILESNTFDKAKALLLHKKNPQKNLIRTKKLIKTIDKTVLHLNERYIMEDKELYAGFQQWAKGKDSTSYFIGCCSNPDECETTAETIVLKSVKKQDTRNKDPSYWEHIEKTAHTLYKELITCIDQGLTVDAEKVRNIIKKHHTFTLKFHEATKKVYKALAELYQKNPAYRDQLDPFCPQLADFLAKAMQVFADKNLT